MCSACREDLLRVPVSECGEMVPQKTETSGVAEKPVAGGVPSAGSEKEGAETFGGFKRKCPDCGKLWPYSRSRCDCGRSLLTVGVYKPEEDNASDKQIDAPTEQPTDVVLSRFYLRSEDGKCEIRLPLGEETIVGRSGAGADYLAEKAFVSSGHAKFTAYEEGIVIEHIGHTNPTQVNNIELERNIPYRIEPGDLIVMGARDRQGYHPSIAYFRLVEDAETGN